MAYVATVVTHVFLLRPGLGPDEGGFLVIAHHWREAGPYLYGPLWVDRPPGLIALFSVADHLGPLGVRIVLTALAFALVYIAGKTAELVGGHRAAPWAAWTAFALGSTILLQAQQLNGEYAAAVCVGASMLLVLTALRGRLDRALALGVASGVMAAAAVTLKQNFLDGFVFAGLLLVSTALIDQTRRRTVAVIAGGITAGLGSVVAAMYVWSRGHGGPGALVFAMYGFRARAADVMEQASSWAPQQQRLLLLLILTLASGLLVLGVRLLWHSRHPLRARNPLAVALVGTALFEVLSLVAGANFWPHYALALIPVTAVGAGLSARTRRPHAKWTRRIVAGMAISTAVISPIAAVANGPGEAWTTGHWVHESSAPGDSIVVPYTHPNVIAASGLRPAYPYLWSLPARTLDPHLTTLTGSLKDPHGPTWVVIWNHPQSWTLDLRGQLQQALHEHYRMVGHVCRHPVWLRSDVTRTLAPLPTDCGGGAL
jgi:hypothetical protein